MQKISITDFDDVFQYIGGFGPYQYVWFLLACFFSWSLGFAQFGQLFMILTPPHWCRIPLDEVMLSDYGLNLTAEDIQRLTIPTETNGIGYEKCLKYDVNFTEILMNSLPWPNSSTPTTTCTDGWNYDYTTYYPTITSQLDWVCDNDWRPPMSQAFYFIGSLVGIPLFSWMADTMGRLPVLVGTNVLSGIFGVASAFSNSFILFCALRFFVGITYDSFYMVTYILALEFVSTPYRTLISNLPPTLFLTASLCCAPWIAHFLHDWTSFSVFISAPQIFCIFLPLIVHDSVRFHLGKGNVEKSVETVRTVAKINGKQPPEEFFQKFQEYAESQKKNIKQRKVAWYDLLRTPELRKRIIICSFMWTAIMIAYDGFMRYSEKIASNFFLTFSMLGLVEMPADLLVIFLMEKVGRKHTTMWSLIGCGIVASSVIFVDETQVTALVGISLAGRFLVTTAINVGVQYIVEVFPTEGRAQGSGVVHTVGIGMAFVSPYVVYLAKIRHWLPFVIFGSICILSGSLCVLLPETLNQNLPDTLEEGEKSFQGQPLFYNPFKRKNMPTPKKGEENPGFKNEESLDVKS